METFHMINVIVMNFFIPVICLIIGIIKPRKNINNTVGYRSKTTKSSQEAWEYGQKLAKKFMLVVGIIYLIISIIAMYFCVVKGTLAALGIGLSVLLLETFGLCAVAFLMERKMKKMNFAPDKKEE